MRYLSAWLILFGSKFVMLGAIDLAFGDEIHFGGTIAWRRSPLLSSIVVMLAAEELAVRLNKRLAK